MNSEPHGKRFFWPVLFISAFALGALLWGLAMYRIAIKTRRQREDGFFVPRNQPAESVVAVTNISPPGPRTNH